MPLGRTLAGELRWAGDAEGRGASFQLASPCSNREQLGWLLLHFLRPSLIGPNIMLGRLITVEAYQNAMQAHLAKNHLEAAGIHSVLPDEHSVSNLWHLSGAIGGIKLQVAESDLERAEAVLDALENHRSDAASVSVDVDADDDDAEDEPKPEQKPPDKEDAEDEESKLNPREQNAERAYPAALIGMVFPPLQFYATWLLLSVWQEDTPLRPAVQRQPKWAILFNLPLVLVAFGLVAIYLRAFIYGI